VNNRRTRIILRASAGLLCALCGLAALSACLATPTPRAEFSVNPPFDYPPLDVQFDASASTSPNGTITAYKWDFGDGGKDTGVIVTHTFTEKGVYSVTLTVTDSLGKSDSRTRNVEALDRKPTAIFTFSPYWVGVRQPVRFDASDSYDEDGEIVQYIWSFGDGSTDEGVIVEHEYQTANGSGWKPTVTLTVVDEDGESGSTSKQVHVVGCDSCGG
jgi:PKD repeat protein